MKQSPLKTPVAFFIFNRPETTAFVFEEIRRARPSQLLVIADGPRSDHADEPEKIAAARALIDQVDWPCEVLKNYAESNLGCKIRISSGLDWVFSQVEEAILLEDDCLPHPTFFPYCEALLERYREDERIMMIGGTNFLAQLDISESYVFSRYFYIWGWATWRRAWAKYDVNLSSWPTMKAQKQLEAFFPQKYVVEYLKKSFDAVQNGSLDTWDFQWVYACLFQHGLSIVPRVNLISNIGVTGTHTAELNETHPNFYRPTYPLNVEYLCHPSLIFANRWHDAIYAERHLYISPLRHLRIKLGRFKRKMLNRFLKNDKTGH